MTEFDTDAARRLADSEQDPFYWEGRMRQTLKWACDILDAARKAIAAGTKEGRK